MELDYDNLAIFPMGAEDLDQLMVIEEYSFPTPWKRAMYQNDIANNKTSRFYVIRNTVSGELAAYSGTWFIFEEAHVGSIASKKEYRGQRLAEQLLAYTALQAVNEGLEYIILEVRDTNEAAIQLYSRLGFEQVGLRKGYYSDTGEDALLLICHNLAGLSALLKVNEG